MHKNFCTALAATIVLSGAAIGAFIEESTLAMEESVLQDSPMDQVTSQLTGTWMTTQPYEVRVSDDGSSQNIFIVMSVTPVTIQGMDNTMYAESSLSNTPWAPFRQSVFQLYEYKGKVRLRTYTLAVDEDMKGMLIGMTAVPSMFSGLSKEQLIATLDVELDVSPNGFSGSTPYPYPTGVLGAVEMTSSVAFDGTTLTTADRGYGAQGNVVWGADEDSSYTFERTAPYTSTTIKDNGLVIIDYPISVSDMGVQDGDEMHVHYSGYLPDGMKFDSSYDRDQPFAFHFPPGNRAIPGWGFGMEGLTLNAHRKLIIPSDIGYGPAGNPRANIPGDSTLIFNIHLVHVERPEPTPVEPVKAGESAED